MASKKTDHETELLGKAVMEEVTNILRRQKRRVLNQIGEKIVEQETDGNSECASGIHMAYQIVENEM